MPRTIRRALIAAAAAGLAALTLSGCTLPFTTPIAVPTIAATPLPAAPSTTPPALVPTGPAPALANTGSNWAAMIPSLLTYGQWLLANPAAAPVGTVAAAGCPLTHLRSPPR